MAGLGCWAGGWCWGRTGDTHRTNVEQLHRNFFLNNTDGYIKPKIFPHNKLNKNVRFMPVVIVILSVQLSLGTALSRSLPSVECRVTNVGNLELKDLRRGSHYPSHLEIQPDISQVSGNTHSTQINYGRGQFGTSQQVENSKRLF